MGPGPARAPDAGRVLETLLTAQTPEDVVAALDKKVSREATPQIVRAGAMILQPSDERRRSGSHYTPRSLTEPIVEAALRPILEQLSHDGQLTLLTKKLNPSVSNGPWEKKRNAILEHSALSLNRSLA